MRPQVSCLLEKGDLRAICGSKRRLPQGIDESGLCNVLANPGVKLRFKSAEPAIARFSGVPAPNLPNDCALAIGVRFKRRKDKNGRFGAIVAHSPLYHAMSGSKAHFPYSTDSRRKIVS